MKRKVSSFNEDGADACIIVYKGRNKEMNDKRREKSCSKLRLGEMRCYHYKKKRHLWKDCLQRKKRNEKKKSSSNAIATVVWERIIVVQDNDVVVEDSSNEEDGVDVLIVNNSCSTNT